MTPRVIIRKTIIEREGDGDVLLLGPSGRVTFHRDVADARLEVARIHRQSPAIAERWNAIVMEVVEWRGFADAEIAE